MDGNVGRLVVTRKDRLLRFGAEWVSSLCEAKGTEVVILNHGEDTTLEQDLANADMGFYEFRRQLSYKAELYGARIVVADRWFPSSNTYSGCGRVTDSLPLSIREWTCDYCGEHHDRDVNAARNLRSVAASSAVKVCGEDGSGPGRETRAKPASMKQKPSVKPTMHRFEQV